MHNPYLVIITLLSILSVQLFAQGTKTKAKANPKPAVDAKKAGDNRKEPGAKIAEAKKTEKPVTRSEKAKSGSASAMNEMDTYRAIIEREVAIRQDLADLIAMHSGEFDSLATPEKRFAAAVTKKLIRNESATDQLTRGEAARAVMLYFALDKGMMFTLTGLERYALFDVQENGIMQGKYSVGQIMSGEQLAGVFNAAEEFRLKRENWGKSVSAETEPQP